jgi:hypothetical protein
VDVFSTATGNTGPIDASSVTITTITTTAAPIPEPSALALLGGALAAMGFIRRRRKPV